jgi:hypothetical protein
MIVKMQYIAIAAAVISGFAASENLVAASSCPETVDYVAKGTFGAAPISGPDKFKPFSITIPVCSTKTPTESGPTYAAYSPLALSGTVKSGLTGQATPIQSRDTSLTLVRPATGVDTLQLAGIVPFEGAEVQIKGSLALPSGTLSSTSIAPFPSTSNITSKSEFTYVVTHPAWKASTAYNLGNEILDPAGNIQEVTTAGTSGTTAPAWNETLNGTTTDNTVVWTNEGPLVTTALSIIGSASATVAGGSDKQSSVFLHSDGVQVITAHADGTQSVRPLQGAPVEVGASSDRVMLQFYASGVRDASEVHVEIAGQAARVVYSGASGYFPGLDEVTVELPRSLSWMGEADVVLTADGQTAGPVRIHIQ